MSKETIYCGGGKQVKGEYGTFRAVTINLSNLQIGRASCRERV